MTKDRLNSHLSLEEIKNNFVNCYFDALAGALTLAELLDGKVTPEKEVDELNRRLEKQMANLSQLRDKGREVFGLDLPDPYDPYNQSKTDLHQ